MSDPSELEIAEGEYRRGAPSLGRALDVLTRRWRGGARDDGTILRLLFLLWYRHTEPPGLIGLPMEYSGPSFEEVWQSAGGEVDASPLVLWATAQMAQVASWAIGDEDEWRGVATRLLQRAGASRLRITAADLDGLGTAGDYFRNLLAALESDAP